MSRPPGGPAPGKQVTGTTADKSRSSSAGSSSGCRTGSAGSHLSGSAGSRPSGSAGSRPSGSAGSRPSGSAGSRPSGSAGSRPSGSAGSRPSGSAGSRPSGSAGSRLSGSAGSQTPGSAGSTGSGKLSDRLNPKTVDHFNSSSKNTSAFATLYNSGGVPCRLLHGSVKHKLVWSPFPEQITFDPVLITLAEGIRETVHPYMFVARQGFKELLEVPDAEQKIRNVLPKLIQPIRGALGHADLAVFDAGLDALTQLSNVAGASLNPHLKTLLVSVSKHSMEKKHKEHIINSLQQLEINGGKDALLHIKARVPTYQSVCS